MSNPLAEIKKVDKDQQKLPADQQDLPKGSEDYVNRHTTIKTEDCPEVLDTNPQIVDSGERTNKSGYYLDLVDTFAASGLKNSEGEMPAGYGYPTGLPQKELCPTYKKGSAKSKLRPKMDLPTQPTDEMYNKNSTHWTWGFRKQTAGNEYDQADDYLLRGYYDTVQLMKDFRPPPHKGMSVNDIGYNVPRNEDHPWSKPSYRT